MTMKSFSEYHSLRLDEIKRDVASDLEDWRSENQDQLPFNDLFDGSEETRIVLPFVQQKEPVGILDKIHDAGLKIDYKQGVVFDPSQVSGTISQPKYHRSVRLGKFILGKPEFTAEEKKWWQHQGNGPQALATVQQADRYAVIVSRHPIDIARMSDHQGWKSCHSTPERWGSSNNYFHCSVSEGKGGGAIAYVVEKSDLKQIDQENWRDGEIFKDNDRRVDGIQPISRVRLRMFVNKKHGYDLAVPETRTYGKDIPGFEELVSSWALEKQKPKMAEFGDTRPSTTDFKRMGGSYQDHTADDLFNAFFGDDLDTKDAEYGGKDDYANMADQWDEEINGIDKDFEEKRKNWKFVWANASVDEGDGQPYMYMSATAEIRIPTQMFVKDLPGYNGNNWEERRKVKDALDDVFKDVDIWGIEELGWEEDGNETRIYAHFREENGESRPDVPDDYRSFLERIDSDIEPKFEQFKRNMYVTLMDLGYLDEHAINQYRNDWQDMSDQGESRFKNFTFDWDDKEPGTLQVWFGGGVGNLIKIPLGNLGNIPRDAMHHQVQQGRYSWNTKEEVEPTYMEHLQNWRKLFTQRMVQLFNQFKNYRNPTDERQKWLWPKMKPPTQPASNMELKIEPTVGFQIDKDNNAYATLGFEFDVGQESAHVEDAVEFIDYLDKHTQGIYEEAANLFQTITRSKMIGQYQINQEKAAAAAREKAFQDAQAQAARDAATRAAGWEI